MKKFNFIFINLALFILIIILLGLFRSQNLVRNYEKDLSWHRKVYNKDKYQTLFLGDSRVYHAINPDLFENAYNFAFSANSFTPFYLNLAKERLIKKGQRKIYLGITPESLSIYEGNKEIEKYLKHKLSLISLWNVFKRNIFTSLDLISFLKKGTFKELNSNSPEVYNTIYHQNGWWEVSAEIKESEAMARNYENSLKRFPPDRALIQELLTTIKDWKKEGIDVYGFYLPTSPMVAKAEKRALSKIFSFTDFIEDFNNSGGHWLNLDLNIENPTFDGDHLNKHFAQLFTKKLYLLSN